MYKALKDFFYQTHIFNLILAYAEKNTPEHYKFLRDIKFTAVLKKIKKI